MFKRAACIILDFDGVIVESVNIKTNAFREIFARYPEAYYVAMTFHRENLGLPRHEKFKYLFKFLLNADNAQSMIQKSSEEFSEMVFDKMINCPLINGALEFLSYFSQKVPLYLVSSTPQDELNRIVRKRSLSKYFRRVIGSAREKSEIISHLLKEEGLPGQSVFYLGDTVFDFRAAEEAGINFIAITHEGDKPQFPGDVAAFPTLAEAAEYLKGHSL